jgi:hypothetical protein
MEKFLKDKATPKNVLPLESIKLGLIPLLKSFSINF